MKIHIVQAGETVDKILKKYNMSENDFSVLNPDSLYRQYEVGDKIRVKDNNNTQQIIEDISSLYQSKKVSVNDLEDQKYICPHCKNIILIPKSN